MKPSNLHQPLSLDRDDHPIAKYTTFNTEMLHMEEHQPVATSARENSNPCNPDLYSWSRHLSQQHFEMQHNATRRQQGISTSARFFTKRHQSDPIVQWENQNHGQTNKMPNISTMQKSGTLHDTLHTIKMTKDTGIAAPVTKWQVTEISAPTVRRNLQVSASLKQETDINIKITGQQQQGSASATDRNITQMEIKTLMGSSKISVKDLADLLEVASQDDITDILSKDIRGTGLNERTGHLQDFNQIRLDTTNPKDTTHEQDFPPLQDRFTTSTPLSVQDPPTLAKEKHVPSMAHQIDFHWLQRKWFETASDGHHFMTQQP
jgi:hypothetical protein